MSQEQLVHLLRTEPHGTAIREKYHYLYDLYVGHQGEQSLKLQLEKIKLKLRDAYIKKIGYRQASPDIASAVEEWLQYLDKWVRADVPRTVEEQCLYTKGAVFLAAYEILNRKG